MKKIISLILALTMVLMMTACGQETVAESRTRIR